MAVGNGVRFFGLWKRELQALANELGITICVAHHPPGTSKWNRIEHRMFSFITQNWRGKPLLTYKVIVQLIANTSTKTGSHDRLPHQTPTPMRRASKSPTRR